MRLSRRLCGMLYILQLGLDQGCLRGVFQYVFVKVPLVVDLVDELVDAGQWLHTAALQRLGAHDLAVVHYELLVEGRWHSQRVLRGEGYGRHTIFLHLHGQRRVRLLDEVKQRSNGLRPRGGHQLLAQCLRRLHLASIVLVGRLCLALQILLVLGRGLGPLETELPAGARVARLDAVEVVGKLVVLGLCLLREPLGVLDLVLRGQALLLPCLAVRVHLVCQLQQVLVHGVQGEAELGAIVGNALVGVQDVLELGRVALVASLGLAQAVDGEAAQLLEAGGVFLLEGAAALEEARKVLWGRISRRTRGGRLRIPARSRCWL